MNWAVAAVLGGVVGLDGISFPQAMISRPLVAGALAGWIAGMPQEGVMLGAVLEAFHLAILPIGASRYPESGTATVAATIAYVWAAPIDTGAGILLALVFALAWERLTGASVTVLRHANERILAWRGGARSARGIEARHLLAMAADLVRGAVVTLAGAGAGFLWLELLEPLWSSGPVLTRGVVVAAAAGTAAAALRVFGGWAARWKLFVAGLACGLLLLVVR
jgi:PTS system mannose-specific IIC component